ncbi:MAG: hypothetical protein A3J54_03150 [Candidatus Ryanbacteria bacterium RIFCSPHIGHO2_02_FULL_45_13b]|uniref:DUF6922 domain-containing protein n=1 Tax=Candidatus Ryanbacteria bacterium RIFCSPHIGHO2_02_FULL_45_13b TaxID=1802117 RepID=A0A1G2G451_9BACT|nr:MAG: hypothetical protein A3J54_03150 [Candidatus Ryanbacteria bacterium RIFCSPHIGHO2_02_FULL_45_13b]
MYTLEKRNLFWDTDVDKIDIQKNARFVIERVLQYGDEGDFHWALDIYGADTLKDILKKNRILDKKSHNFWCMYFTINPEQCFPKQSMSKQGAFLRR